MMGGAIVVHVERQSRRQAYNSISVLTDFESKWKE